MASLVSESASGGSRRLGTSMGPKGSVELEVPVELEVSVGSGLSVGSALSVLFGVSVRIGVSVRLGALEGLGVSTVPGTANELESPCLSAKSGKAAE